MKSFTLFLQDNIQTSKIDGVTSFVGEDVTGSFGILPDHARMMTVLVMGLARFRIGAGNWQYIATPGALVYFHENQLVLSARHYLVDEDYTRISNALEQELLEEESQLQSQKKSLRHMEEMMLKRLWELGRPVP